MNFAFPRKSAHSECIFLWSDFLGFCFFAFSMQIFNYQRTKLHAMVTLLHYIILCYTALFPTFEKNIDFAFIFSLGVFQTLNDQETTRTTGFWKQNFMTPVKHKNFASLQRVVCDKTQFLKFKGAIAGR